MKAKYNGLMLDVFREVFNWLPLAFVLKKQVLVLHGGLFSQDGVTLDDLRKVQRNRCATKPPWAGQLGRFREFVVGASTFIMCVCYVVLGRAQAQQG